MWRLFWECHALRLLPNLGSILLDNTSGDEMSKIKIKIGLYLKFLLFSDIYKIQIVQNNVQLSSKVRFNQSPLFLIH